MKPSQPKSEVQPLAPAPRGGSFDAAPGRAAELLHAIIQGTAATTGTQFFRSLVKHLAEGLHVRFAFVAECLPDLRARSLAFYQDNSFGQDFEYALPGTPCMEVAKGRVCHVPDRLAEEFPADKGMIDLGTVSYLGVPLRGSDGRVIGHLVTFDDKPMPSDPLALSVLETFAARAAVELERDRAFKDLERRKQESDERYRDLFEEAPIAYVNEGLDSKFIRANRAALNILGIKPEDVPTTYGKTFVPDTPEAQRRMREAFESIGRGTDTSGVMLELRRKDNGKPLWIQWWSRPDISGNYTRTMFVDITERVLMEQEKARLEAQNTYLQEEIRSEHNFDEIVGSSPALMDVLQQVDQIARIDSTVLILGESGTGKELIARAIHDRSPRRDRALVKVNCGAISAGLVESELFGHVKGAFTGAIANRDGRFKLADGGTIFLDEVGELPPDTQVKLLRVLQEREFEPIGSSKTIKVSVRVVAATNRNLEEAVREGKFRDDLFYRLNVVPLRVPPLRERASDIHLLSMFFIQQFAQRMGKRITQVSDEAMRELTCYSWPGNIRELQNVIERAVILSPGNTLVLAGKLRASTSSPPLAATAKIKRADIAPAATSDGSRNEAERRHIESVLNQTNWMIEGERGAAKILEMNPSTLRSRMQRLGIRRPARQV
ncbi:MAG: domain S-box protein [Pedosphaera sp.]|nr:domain S-box protein [Pedosphaera sp.]